ncbi:uncharacterized protein ACA1_068980 [Acanthamoeba castellanii str. Neff]|uniref:Methyltransferase domain-containing protein n=1 Tax=Acanthamoeba castellanii (strain ATCC 30010 / Neff) TaxID=1257118 RepID=L8HCP0_ACACF|nr:uncharacterized protein ACA1_068980 [Acanthamoeba castellanii str. Neff]ELR23314.1 hypothetical protein ACA1_068980 [Acanthamoeba castellanii str. Neff]
MVPEEWRPSLLTLTDDELKVPGSTPASDNLPSTITIVVKSLPERLTPEMRAKFPPSLVSTLETAYSLHMPRSFSQIMDRLKPGTDGVAELNEGVELNLFQGTAVTKAPLSFSYILAQGMSPKKIHEVTRMSKLVVELCKALNVDTGYVSHVLSQHYGYRVMAVEGNEDYSDKGVARVQSISTRIRKRVVEAVQTAIKQAIRKERARVGGEAAAADEPAEDDSAPHKYILIGLHTCGDLAHKVVDLFLQSTHAVGLVGVGCCYQLTTSLIGEHATIDYGTPLSIYPRSSLLRERRFRLGWGGLKIATESCYQYSQKQGADFTHVHHSLSFRAILEVLVRKYYPEGHREEKHPKELWQSVAMHPEYGPGNWKGSGRDIACTDADDCAAPPPLAQEAKAKNKNVLEFSHDLKVRFRFKKLRQKDYATEKLYLLQSIKRFIIKTDDKPNWRPVDFGAFALFHDSQNKQEDAASAAQREEEKERLMQDMLAVFDQYKDREREVAVWAALQMLLNPLLESLLLLDRLLYIEEFKTTYVRAELLPLFDVVHSPRNVAIVAHKATLPTSSL